MVITIRNMNGVDSHSSRILAALAASVVYRYNKRVLILQSGRHDPIEDMLAGRRIRDSHIMSDETAFEDSGMDALLRRVEMGQLSAKQFSDCCYSMLKADNTFDVAGISKVQDFDVYLSENMGAFRELLRSGCNVYDIVFVYINSLADKLAEQVEEICAELNNDAAGCPLNIICSLQGYRPTEDVSDHSVVITDYSSDSCYTVQRMRYMHKTRNLFIIPQDIAFRDACLSDDAITFLASNIDPEEWEDTYPFAKSCTKVTGMLLGMNEQKEEKKEYSYLPSSPEAGKLNFLQRKGRAGK